MRSTTKSIISVLSIGLVAASYKFGIETYAAQNASLSSLGGGVIPTETVGTPAATPTATDPSSSPTATPKPTASGGTKPAPAPKPKPTTPSKPKPTKPATGGASTPSVVTKAGAAIRYNFGSFQVSVTKTDGSITAVNLLQASYTRAPQGTENWLVQSAIASQGSSFGNISRATYTTMAFKSALDSALAKF